MTWIMIILIWLVAPFVELGIIIALTITNDKYKKRIQELEQGRMSPIAAMRTYEYNIGQPMEDETPPAEDTGVEPAKDIIIQRDERTYTKPDENTEPMELFKDSGWHSCEHITGENNHPSPSRKGLGMFALILGVVFIVLAGLIFATTTWHILPDICKVLSVFLCSVLFFGVSHLSERRFHVHKTGNAFYILGSIFLFLAILAAAYFKLMGAEFILEGKNRWKVLWVGSVVTVTAFWAGIRRFHDRIYTQACLWGISINLFFMAKAFSLGWDGFVAVMMVYSAVLVLVREYLKGRGTRTDQEHGFLNLLFHGFGSFVPVHFWIFGSITMIRSLFAIWIMVAECATGYQGLYPERISLFSFTLVGMISLFSLTVGTGVLVQRKKAENKIYLFYLAALETIMYTAGWITDDFIYRMAIINGVLLMIQLLRYRKKETEGKALNLFWDICTGGSLLSGIIIMWVLGYDTWRFVYLLMAALYGVSYRTVESVKRQALSLSACFVAAAFWLEPFIVWPQVIRMEMNLLPFTWLLWTIGMIWDKTLWILAVQNLGYVMCLVLLFLDAVFSGLVVDALILEGICLAAFVWAQVKESGWWVRISGGMSLVVALFMTRGFWLSISWWVYLLGAGIGLVVFAGIMEKKE